ncbi:MAG: hypothetical protein QXE76_01525 [Candidatus Bathyarchaeia archaeon]
MRIGLILFLITIIIILGPLLIGILMYNDNLIALVLPTQETIENLQDAIESLNKTASFSYEGYEPVGSDSLRVRFTISNPYTIDLTVQSVSMKAYCHEHNTYIGSVQAENTPLLIPAKSSKILNLIISYSPEGKADINAHHVGVNNLYLDLKEAQLKIQGIEITITGEMSQIGPLLIPS